MLTPLVLTAIIVVTAFVVVLIVDSIRRGAME